MDEGLQHYCPKCDADVYASAASCPRCNLGRPDHGWPRDEYIGAVMAEKYRIHRRLGRGGMGSVYLAEQVHEGTSLGRVAIKFLQPMGTAAEQEFLKNKFISEARFARLFNSPNIIKVYDFGTHAGQTYMAMEFLEGVTLQDILYRRGTFQVRGAVDICLQVAEALAEVHRHDVIHRDVKPENILVLDVKGKDFVKLLDFGIAKKIDPSFQKSSTQIGTPAYMAPEQFRGEAIDARADIYALGILMHTCLVGEPPFVYDSLEEMHPVSPPIPDIADKRPGLPEPLRRLVNSMMHPDPAMRPSTAGDVVDALRSLQSLPPERPRELEEVTSIPLATLPAATPPHRSAEPMRMAVSVPRTPPRRLRPVTSHHRPGAGRLLVWLVILLGLLAVGDYVYIHYFYGMSLGEIFQGLGAAPPAPSPPVVDAEEVVDGPPADTGTEAAGEDPAAKDVGHPGRKASPKKGKSP